MEDKKEYFYEMVFKQLAALIPYLVETEGIQITIDFEAALHKSRLKWKIIRDNWHCRNKVWKKRIIAYPSM